MNEPILREMRETDLPALFAIKEIGRTRGFALARGEAGEEIDEVVFRLD